MDVDLSVRIGYKHHDSRRDVSIEAYVVDGVKCSAPEMVFSGTVDTAHVSEFISTQQFVTKCLFDALIAMNDEADRDGYLPVPQLMLDASEQKKD